VYRACTDRIRNVSDNISFQIAGDLGVGGRVGRRSTTEIGIAARARALAALAPKPNRSIGDGLIDHGSDHSLIFPPTLATGLSFSEAHQALLQQQGARRMLAQVLIAEADAFVAQVEGLEIARRSRPRRAARPWTAFFF
jgi:hypothetical protein